MSRGIRVRFGFGSGARFPNQSQDLNQSEKNMTGLLAFSRYDWLVKPASLSGPITKKKCDWQHLLFKLVVTSQSGYLVVTWA